MMSRLVPLVATATRVAETTICDQDARDCRSVRHQLPHTLWASHKSKSNQRIDADPCGFDTSRIVESSALGAVQIGNYRGSARERK